MLTVNYIRENKKDVIERLAVRQFDASQILDDVILKDDIRKKTQSELDETLAQSNQLAKMIGGFYKSGEAAKAEEAKKETAQLKIKSKELSDSLSSCTKELNELLFLIPNLPHHSVPKGKTPEDNQQISQENEFPELGEHALPHWDLAAKYSAIDS